MFAAQPELEGEWLGLVQAALAHPRWPVRERAVLTLAANAQMAPALRDTLWRLLEDAQVGEPVAWALLGLDQTSDDLATRCARSVLRSRGIDNEDALVFETAFWKLEDAAQERAVSRLRALAATEHPGADDARKVLDLFKHFFEPAGE